MSYIMATMFAHDKDFMSVALQCAARGRGSVEPNPMVGAVLVRDGRELARGWHGTFGGPHAEIVALEAARSAGADTAGATMYVTLEPCCHEGKTPPCTEAIIAAGISRVVVAMDDPAPQVSGGGLAALREAGIEVCTDVCQTEARGLLAAYIKLCTTGRPWVICKWAQTADGYLAMPGGKGRWVSGEKSRAEAHRVRGLCDGVCVGIGTVLADDPLLTNRGGGGRRPVRVVLDSKLRIPMDCWLVRTSKEAPVLVATTSTALAKAEAGESLRDQGVEVLELPAVEGRIDLEALLDEMGRRRWTHLLVEGGAKVLESFVSSHLADELLVFISPRELGPEAQLPRFDIEEAVRRLDLGRARETHFGEDRMLRYVIRR